MKAPASKAPVAFDSYAADYRKLLNDSVRISGESVEYFAALKARYLQRSFGEWFTGNVLDYGCGVGLLSRFLVDAFPEARIDGYDPSEASISHIPETVTCCGSFTADLGNLRRDYDLIVVANVIHHVPPPERQGIISGIASHMARGGRLFIFEHNPLNPLTRRAVRLCPFDADAILLWPPELRRYLTGAGLNIETRDYVVFFPRMLKWLRPLEPALTWCALGAQYVISGARL